eukprot:scaffold35843_cov1532-Skeletonema_dohrnii-CCMP3373.AAC.2
MSGVLESSRQALSIGRIVGLIGRLLFNSAVVLTTQLDNQQTTLNNINGASAKGLAKKRHLTTISAIMIISEEHELSYGRIQRFAEDTSINAVDSLTRLGYARQDTTINNTSPTTAASVSLGLLLIHSSPTTVNDS